MPEPTVRPARPEDLARIHDIYNHYVLHSQATFDVEPMTWPDRHAWARQYAATGPYRLVVVTSADGVMGYATSSRYKARAAYETSVEFSVYLDPQATGQGLGAVLYAALLSSLESEDLHRAYGGITLPNPASVALHERFGFRQVAVFNEQGRKFGRYWDVAWFERPLP